MTALSPKVSTEARERTRSTHKQEFIGPPEEPSFSLVLGGPLYQLFLRTRLVRPPMELLARRIIAAVLVTWLPLALLAALGGTLVSGVRVPFLYDLDVHVRFLVAVPLLIASELIVHRRLRVIVGQFTERNLIAPEDRRAFADILAAAMRLRDSAVIEIVLLVFSFTAFYWLWRSQSSLTVTAWYGSGTPGGMSFTWAGYWYVFVSVSLARFILLRWYFRIFIWYVFLFRVSRLRLQLDPLHPDQAGGLGFLSFSVDAISPILFAQSTFLAGLIGNQIFYAGATLPDFKYLIGSAVAFLMLVALLPLAFFAPPMAAAKRAALPEYGALAARFTSDFQQKWLMLRQLRGKELRFNVDIQSLASLASAYAVIRDMGFLPFGRNAVVRLAVLIALPLLPLALTMFPFEVILQQLIKVVL